jgi:hypothetical protein
MLKRACNVKLKSEYREFISALEAELVPNGFRLPFHLAPSQMHNDKDWIELISLAAGHNVDFIRPPDIKKSGDNPFAD